MRELRARELLGSDVLCEGAVSGRVVCVCESVRVLVCERVVWVRKLCVSKLCVCTPF
jgi:hypothetical protein